MTATDELRRLLDECVVEHYDGWSGEIRYTKWQGNYGMWFLTHDSFGTDGKLLYVQGIDMTPEQAVEATLGRGTCHCTTPDDAWCFSCSVCGKSFPRSDLHMAHNHGAINYCPNCGAKVVDA